MTANMGLTIREIEMELLHKTDSYGNCQQQAPETLFYKFFLFFTENAVNVL